jgi:hypothetical protein
MAKKRGVKRSSEQSVPRKEHSPEDRFRILLEASRLSEAELGEFLRREGLHQTTLDEWREAAIEALKPSPSQSQRSGDAKRVKELERELRRKEKALAETAALLVLQKKVQALLAVADDDTDPESDES